MAWSEQCKVSFAMNVVARTKKGEKRRSEAAILREVAAESDIPFKTLERWWAEWKKSRLENEVKPITTEDDTVNQPEEESIEAPIPKCKNGCEKDVHISSTGNPYGPKSKYYGLCSSCRRTAQKKVERNKAATPENGIEVICPKCGHNHYVLIK